MDAHGSALVRQLRADDFEALNAVLSRAYQSVHDYRPRLRTYAQMARAQTFVIDVDGAPSAIVVGNDYVTSAYVSLMGVDPALHRRGLATRLMEALLAWSDERGFACVELDATAAGAPLYERFGFRDAGSTAVYTNTAAAGPNGAVRVATQADRAALLACDRDAFGADRAEMLDRLAERTGSSVFVAGTAARIDGYAVAQREAGAVGPVIASDAQLAADLFDAARAALAAPCSVSIPADNAAAIALVEARECTFARSLRHMVRGSRPPAARARIYARANLGQG